MEWHNFLSKWRRSGPCAPEPRPAVLPDHDDVIDCELAEEFECEGQSFMIEYTDAGGEGSCRSISVRSVKYNDNGEPYLAAYCHHRNATRHFRVDRIECCIDFDGVVHEANSFLWDTLGLNADLRGPVADVDGSRLLAARKQARPHAILLAGLSRCDNYMHPDELSVLRQHCEQLRDDLTLDECDRLGKNYRRLRPSAEQIADALEKVRAEPPAIIEKFLVAAHQLIRADGKLTPEEISLFDEFSRELTGVGWLQPG